MHKRCQIGNRWDCKIGVNQLKPLGTGGKTQVIPYSNWPTAEKLIFNTLFLLVCTEMKGKEKPRCMT